MNKNRRARLKTIEEELSKCSELLNSILDEEQDCMDNIPENLRETDRYYTMEECVDTLGEVISSLDDAINSINSVT